MEENNTSAESNDNITNTSTEATEKLKIDIAEFEIDDLVKLTYTKIAEWHNETNTPKMKQLALKHLTLELIEDIAGKAFNHIGLNYTPALYLDEQAKKLLEEEKAKMGVSTKSLDEMTKEELLAEIKKRQK